MNTDQDESNISTFLSIIEEYVLLGFVQIQEFLPITQIVSSKYEFANTFEGSTEECIEIKTACLNLASTMVLIIYDSKSLEHLKIFEVKK